MKLLIVYVFIQFFIVSDVLSFHLLNHRIAQNGLALLLANVNRENFVPISRNQSHPSTSPRPSSTNSSITTYQQIIDVDSRESLNWTKLIQPRMNIENTNSNMTNFHNGSSLVVQLKTEDKAAKIEEINGVDGGGGGLSSRLGFSDLFKTDSNKVDTDDTDFERLFSKDKNQH